MSASGKKWFVVHAYSGFEKSVQRALTDRIKRSDIAEQFGKILVPVEEVVEMKGGQKAISERKFFPGYRPQFYFRTTDVTGSIVLPEGTEMVMPGDNVSMTVELIAPIAMEEGLRFAIREGGRTVGAGVVAKIIE